MALHPAGESNVLAVHLSRDNSPVHKWSLEDQLVETIFQLWSTSHRPVCNQTTKNNVTFSVPEQAGTVSFCQMPSFYTGEGPLPPIDPDSKDGMSGQGNDDTDWPG